MLLNDIGKAPESTLKKINQHLESNYGFKISEDAKDQDLVAIMETIQDEISDLKIQGNDAKTSPEISKRLLILEGLSTLREFALIQFQSPKLEMVIKGMSDFVVDTFHHSGTSMADFDEAVRDAMKVYRSSPYRFPDDYIEQRVRSSAMAKIESPEIEAAELPTITSMPEDTEIEAAQVDGEMNIDALAEDFSAIPFTKNEFHERRKVLADMLKDPATSKNVQIRNKVMKEWNLLNQKAKDAGFIDQEMTAEEMSTMDESGVVPMARDPQTGNIQQDPNAAQAAERRKGLVMKEHKNLVKNLRRLLETEVSQAEVMMAAKGFAQELQEMVEKIGRLQNEDLPPVTDQMRETYGQDSASAFQTQIYGALQGVMDALYTAKNQVDDAVDNMASTGQVTAAVDMDKDIGGVEGEVDADLGMEPELDLDNIGDELEADDEFGGAEGEEPLGRTMKESKELQLKKKIAEMQKIVAKARKLKEAKR